MEPQLVGGPLAVAKAILLLAGVDQGPTPQQNLFLEAGESRSFETSVELLEIRKVEVAPRVRRLKAPAVVHRYKHGVPGQARLQNGGKWPVWRLAPGKDTEHGVEADDDSEGEPSVC